MEKHIHFLRHDHKIVRNLFLVVFSILILSFFISANTHASKVKYVKRFSVSTHSQGAVLTKDYYVFSVWDKPNNKFKIRRCNRPGGGNCKTTSESFSGKPSSMYHKWGTDYAQAIKKENSGMVCIQISTMKKVGNKKCGSMMTSSGLSKSGDSAGLRQGWTKYGNVYLRGYGISGSVIWVFKSRNKKPVMEWKVPLSGEIEDVFVEGDTGQVWFTWYAKYGTIDYYSVSKSVFSKYIKAGADSGSSDKDDATHGGVRPEINPMPVYTPVESEYDGTMDTNFFGKLQEDEEGCGVFMILNLILDILTYGVAIAAIIGIAISGTMYLTAGGNELQVEKAKRRIFEIVIGLFAYASLYAALGFLLPGGKFTVNKECSQATSKSSDEGNESNDPGESNGETDTTPVASSSADKIITNAEKVAAVFQKDGYKFGSNSSCKWKEAKKSKTSNSATFACLALKEAGLITSDSTWFEFTDYGKTIKGKKKDIKNNPRLSIVKGNDTVENLYKKGKLKRGDIVGSASAKSRTMIFVKKDGNKYLFYSAHQSGKLTKSKILNYKVSGSHKIGLIIRAK